MFDILVKNWKMQRAIIYEIKWYTRVQVTCIVLSSIFNPFENITTTTNRLAFS